METKETSQGQGQGQANATAMANANPSAKKPRQEKPRHSGVNSREVFAELMTRDYDPHQVQVVDLTFGTRRRGGGDQVVSVLDTGTGDKIDVYPVLSRFKPTLGRSMRCFVVLKPGTEKGRGGKEVPVMRGFAIPVNLREAARLGEWLGLRNNILTLRFRRNKQDQSFYGFGPNGKIVIVPEGAGLNPPPSTEEEASYMVSELLNCFLVHCVVPEDQLGAPEGDTKDQGLVLQAETVGAVLQAVDTYGFMVARRLFDACEIMGLPATATEAEVKKQHRELARTEHPDVRCNAFRELTGAEPMDADKQGFNFEWTLIEKAYEKMLLVRVRDRMRRKHKAAGEKAELGLPKQLTVRQLAKKADTTVGRVKLALKNVGYPGVYDSTIVDQVIALTTIGFILSGALDTADDLSAESDDKNGDDDLDFMALALAYKMGAKFNGRSAAEVVAKLKAASKIPANWPDGIATGN